MEGGSIFWLRIPNIGEVITVFCEESKSSLFSNSKQLYNEALACFDVEESPLQYFYSLSPAQTLDVRHPCQGIDLRRTFVAVASIQGVRAVGLGSNKISYERAARLAFAVAVALQNPDPAATRIKEIAQVARHAPCITCGRLAGLVLATPYPRRRSSRSPQNLPGVCQALPGIC